MDGTSSFGGKKMPRMTKLAGTAISVASASSTIRIARSLPVRTMAGRLLQDQATRGRDAVTAERDRKRLAGGALLHGDVQPFAGLAAQGDDAADDRKDAVAGHHLRIGGHDLHAGLDDGGGGERRRGSRRTAAARE